MRHLSSSLTASVALLFFFGLGALSAASGAPCGDVTGPCSCGDTVVDNPTTLDATDPITQAPCNCGPGGVALRVDPGVTLSLGFHTIEGAGARVCTIGILIGGNGVTVASGRITNFQVGVANAVPATVGATLMGLNVYDNDFGIFLGNVVSQTTVKNNLVRLNGANGIIVNNLFGGPANNLVSGNRSEENGGQGVVVQGIMNTVTGNFSQRNAGDGFDIVGSGATVKQNRAKYNGLEGFKLQGTGHSVSLNEAHMNGTDGFTVFATMSRFNRNRSDYNGAFGILDATLGFGGNVYTDNRCTGNDAGNSFLPGLCQ